MPEMVQKLALAIAEGQTKLDMNSTKVAKFMSDTKISLPKLDGTGEEEFPLISLGFFPGFYQFQEAIIEVKMAITMAKSNEFGLNVGAKAGWGPFSASVNASYKSKYNYSQEGSSLLRVKLAPAPPPTLLENYMNALVEIESAKVQAKIDAQNATPATP
jgi:hypothetical protein